MDALPDARNSTTPAISSGSSQRDVSAAGSAFRLAGVSITLGTSAFTVMPKPTSSFASDSEKESTAAFAAEYADMLAAPWLTAGADDTFTMRPHRAVLIAGTAARQQRKALVALSCIMRF